MRRIAATLVWLLIATSAGNAQATSIHGPSLVDYYFKRVEALLDSAETGKLEIWRTVRMAMPEEDYPFAWTTCGNLQSYLASVVLRSEEMGARVAFITKAEGFHCETVCGAIPIELYVVIDEQGDRYTPSHGSVVLALIDKGFVELLQSGWPTVDVNIDAEDQDIDMTYTIDSYEASPGVTQGRIARMIITTTEKSRYVSDLVEHLEAMLRRCFPSK